MESEEKLAGWPAGSAEYSQRSQRLGAGVVFGTSAGTDSTIWGLSQDSTQTSSRVLKGVLILSLLKFFIRFVSYFMKGELYFDLRRIMTFFTRGINIIQGKL